MVNPQVGEELPDPRQLSGVILTGSHAMVTDRAAWSERTEAWLRLALEVETPVLGICYGHQLLAHAAGGKVGINPRGRQFGTVEVQLLATAIGDPLLAGLPGRFSAHTSHCQSVLALPPGAIALATTARDPHHAYRLGRAAWGVQFHPEFDAQVMKTYIDEFFDQLDAEGLRPAELLRHATETPVCAGLLGRFAEIALAGPT